MTNEIILQNMEKSVKPSPAREKLQKLFDDGSFTELDAYAAGGEAVIGFGVIEGVRALAFAQDKSVNNGAMGKASVAKIKKVYELSAETGVPVVGIFDSDGAHIDEGFDVLAALSELLNLSGNISGVVPQISVVSGVCGGSAAMVAANADIVIMEKSGELFLNPPSLLNDKEAGTSAVALANGTAHVVTDDFDGAVAAVRTCITSMPSNNLSVAPIAETVPPSVELDALAAGMDKAFDIRRVIDGVFDDGSFFELSNGFGTSVVTGFARLNGISCGVIAADRNENKGYLNAESAAKAARMIRLLDSFNIPAVTFIDTLGFAPCAKWEKRGALRPSSAMAQAYAEATNAKIAVLVGRAVGPAYMAMGGKAAADLAVAWYTAEISPLAPDAAVTVMYSERLAAGESRAALLDEYRQNVSSPLAAAEGGYIDDVIKPSQTRERLISAVDVLLGKRVSGLAKKHSNMPL